MKFIFTLLCILLQSILSLSQNDRDYIYHENKNRYVLEWNKRNLKWKDFKGIALNKDFTSESYTFYKLDPVQFGEDKDFYKLIIRNCFVPDKSWTTDTLSKSLLEHEQGHFDLSEAGLRFFKKELSMYVIKNKESFNEYFVFTQNKWTNYVDSLSTIYDSDTDHGTKIRQQLNWKVKIDSLLNENTEYSNDTVEIRKWEMEKN